MNDFTVTVDYDQISELSRKYLIDCYKSQQNFPNEPDFKKLTKALLRVIRYVSTSEQWETFEATCLQNI